MERINSRFDFRFEKALYRKLLLSTQKLSRTRNKLIKDALENALIHYRNGYFHVRSKSDFLSRVDKADFKTYQVVFDVVEKEMLRKLAFTLKISQAETLRLAIEYYIHVCEGVVDGESENYEGKCRHAWAKMPVMIVVYNLYSSNSQFYHMFGIPPDYGLNI